MERGLDPRRRSSPGEKRATPSASVGGLYVRIVVMQIAIIVGAYVAKDLRLDRAAPDRHRLQDRCSTCGVAIRGSPSIHDMADSGNDADGTQERRRRLARHRRRDSVWIAC